MGLNFDQLEIWSAPAETEYTEDDVILYALSVGAGVDELDFVYEKNLKVLPTFAVVPFFPMFWPLLTASGANIPTVLHAEHQVVLHGLIPPAGRILTRGRWNDTHDKGSRGAIMNWSFESRDPAGALLFENHAAIFDRTAGGFGGQRGGPTPKYHPPQDREPDFTVEETTSENQAALYRLNGDKNLLHIDPEFARSGGLDRPILHGLCSFGFAGRAVLQHGLGGDPGRLQSLSARFSGVVYPGDTLITTGWRIDDHNIYFQTRTQDDRVALGNGRAEVIPD